MLSTLGICGPDWVIVAADSSVSTSIVCVGDEFDRIIEIDSPNIVSMVGEYIQGNVALCKSRNSVELSTNGISHFLRTVLANNAPLALRGEPAPRGTDGAPALFYQDRHAVRRAGGTACFLSIFDKLYRKDLTFEGGSRR
jgi:hypothetical protein